MMKRLHAMAAPESNAEYVEIEGSGHFYAGYEDQLAVHRRARDLFQAGARRLRARAAAGEANGGRGAAREDNTDGE